MNTMEGLQGGYGLFDTRLIRSSTYIIQFLPHTLLSFNVKMLKCSVNSNSTYFKGNLADESVRINRARPVAQTSHVHNLITE